MGKQNLHLLTYLAQVLHMPFNSALLLPVHAAITPRSLPTLQYKKHGQLRKVIVIIGIAPAVDWGVPNKNMVVWLKDAAGWQQTMIYISSRSHAGERK